MNINITNRLVVIAGPTTSGKTTLSHKIAEQANVKSQIISHDEVLKTIPKNQSKGDIDYQFRMTLLNNILSALNDRTNKLVILDTVNINKTALFSFLKGIALASGYTDNITLLKMNLPLPLNLQFQKSRQRIYKEAPSVRTIIGQKELFASNIGSLNLHDEQWDEFIITDPTNLNITFDLPYNLNKK